MGRRKKQSTPQDYTALSTYEKVHRNKANLPLISAAAEKVMKEKPLFTLHDVFALVNQQIGGYEFVVGWHSYLSHNRDKLWTDSMRTAKTKEYRLATKKEKSTQLTPYQKYQHLLE